MQGISEEQKKSQEVRGGMIDIEHAKQEFENYLDEYDRQDEQIYLKIEHTYGVVKYAGEIARRMECSREDVELAELIGLLHDIGRYEQMEIGTPHHLAGARLAERILTDCDFSLTEQKSILAAIRSHRVKDTAETPLFSRYLYRADKQSRNCLYCPARNACNWPEEKMNLTICY